MNSHMMEHKLKKYNILTCIWVANHNRISGKEKKINKNYKLRFLTYCVEDFRSNKYNTMCIKTRKYDKQSTLGHMINSLRWAI